MTWKITYKYMLTIYGLELVAVGSYEPDERPLTLDKTDIFRPF